MTLELSENIAYVILKKIQESQDNKTSVSFSGTDFAGLGCSKTALLAHLDYLNQKQYINAEFTGNAYANQDDVPSATDPSEFDFRIANTFAASDGPLPHVIDFSGHAELTERGRKLLTKMDENPPKSMEHGPSVPIATEEMSFLEKVMLRGELEDIFDARDVAEVVFRTMRDMMPTEVSDRVEAELHDEAVQTDDKALQGEVAELWKDTNPLVSFLSRIRPALHIKPETFLFRIRQEAGLPRGISPEEAIRAVFAATKDELSSERIQEIAGFLPGEIRQMWEAA
ncbi:DUF2267 domain-containing protein [Leptolyngbya sp. FACHB-261]|uniref:DUF2267 domain-containing protein n=1 Tax=Leptolyngbya sp. FACHB-261 TaxID=2692806 RepID=UPI0016840069|nr:DUF2267 domain-containing protein [Leptolyngbya sp. FACHB-261]MBD2104038.1 DUF2267 domain-containing protein [Leptolyngbya sp. FACHB-261]